MEATAAAYSVQHVSAQRAQLAQENFIAAEENGRDGVNDKDFVTCTLPQVYIHAQLQVLPDTRCRNEDFLMEALVLQL